MIKKIKSLFFPRKTKKFSGYCVPIRGGLGGQIMGFAIYDYLRKNSGLPVVAEASELLKSEKYQLAGKGQGLNQNIWNLKYYGIEMEKNIALVSSLGEVPADYQVIEEGTPERGKLSVLANKTINRKMFPVRDDHQEYIKKKLKSCLTLAIHVRQSDYLNVSSRCISAVDSLPLIKRLMKLNPDRVVFVSEQALDVTPLSEGLGISVETFIQDDYFLVHAFLRSSHLLIVANSQFSISASLLGENLLTFYPKYYFGGKDSHLNREYQNEFDYFVK